MSRAIRIGIDVGGTFTDFALAIDDELHTTKVLTSRQAPEQAIMSGLRKLEQLAEWSPQEVSVLIHGTTLATNAIIERKGARVAMITTEGFRDVLELGTESRFDQYDLNIRKPEPLVPRNLRFTVPERLAADGSVLLPLDLGGLETIAEDLRAQRVDSVAICFLHSFVNAEHEQRVAQALRNYLPDVHISLSAQVVPEIREYERFSTTVANAYVQPLIAAYLQRLEGALRQAGFACPWYVFLSNGALAEPAMARQFPVRLVESGPAGGAIFASHVARRHGQDSILSFDMGGTTAKICLIDQAEPQKAGAFEIARAHRFKQGSGLPLRIPVIEMVEIGAGGGSVARIDGLQRIVVGPDSAGSEPGPACYGLGGEEATVTDADLVLGRMEADCFADGSMRLDIQAAQSAIDMRLATPLGMEVAFAAHGVAAIVEEDMANAAREHAAESGKSLRGRTLVAFGGAAPLHALPLAAKLGIERIIVPRCAGVGSAVGFLLAPVAFELTRSCRVRLSQFRHEEINRLFQDMGAYAHGVVASAAPHTGRGETRRALMRYVGQGYDIPVTVPLRSLCAADSETLRVAFDDAYTHLYSRPHAGIDIEIVGVSLSVSAFPDWRYQAPSPAKTARRAAAHPDHAAPLFDPDCGASAKVPVHVRAALQSGDHLTGPALIRDQGTTILVVACCMASVADQLDLVIETGAAA
jgi:N-methylhydantoinase A